MPLPVLVACLALCAVGAVVTVAAILDSLWPRRDRRRRDPMTLLGLSIGAIGVVLVLIAAVLVFSLWPTR